MSQRRSWVLALAGVCTPLLAAGCGARTVPVKGVVTFDGKPLAHAFVLFIHQEAGGRDASGTTDAQGAFRLSTFRPNDGALPGSYKVTVHYSDPVAVPPDLRAAEDVQAAMVKAGAGRKASVILPPTYSQPDRTVLKHRVPEDGDVKLELTGAKR
jgi:hypothetical protein